jgi:hypothetical protein
MSAARTDASRPLLVVIDPTSYSTAEMRGRIASLVAALAIESPKRPSIRTWLCIAANDGILVDPRLREGVRPAEVVEAVMRIMQVRFCSVSAKNGKRSLFPFPPISRVPLGNVVRYCFRSLHWRR